MRGATLGQDAALKAAHIEEQVGVVLAVRRHKAVLPLHGGHRARQAVLDVPEHSAAPERGEREKALQFCVLLTRWGVYQL